MTKSLLSIALIIAFVLMQGLSLHGHYSPTAHNDHPHALPGHDKLHIHHHAIAIDSAATEIHPDEEEVNLLGTPLLRDIVLDQPILLQSLLWAIVLLVVWVSRDLPRPLATRLHPSPPKRFKPSPRAPPR